MSVKLTGVYHHFTWVVPDFFNLPKKYGYFLQSAQFRYTGDFYCLRLYPNGTNKDDSSYVCIVLTRLSSSVPEKDISYEIGYRSSNGGEFRFEEFHSVVESVGQSKFSKRRSVFEREADTYVPGGILTLYCRIHTSSEGQQKGSPGVEKLQSDYKQLLLKGAESDACLVVCGKEFQAHRNVLRARSPVFEAMFDHETAEKDTGRVVMDDLNPDCVQVFLEYLYTGRVEAFSDDNVFGLYIAADKYDVPTLMSECVEHICRSVSVDNFCDVVTLAFRHGVKDLLQLAVEFFKENVASIILTVKWQQFMRENSATANELFIKLHVPGKESDNVLVL